MVFVIFFLTMPYLKAKRPQWCETQIFYSHLVEEHTSRIWSLNLVLYLGAFVGLAILLAQTTRYQDPLQCSSCFDVLDDSEGTVWLLKPPFWRVNITEVLFVAICSMSSLVPTHCLEANHRLDIASRPVAGESV